MEDMGERLKCAEGAIPDFPTAIASGLLQNQAVSSLWGSSRSHFTSLSVGTCFLKVLEVKLISALCL